MKIRFSRSIVRITAVGALACSSSAFAASYTCSVDVTAGTTNCNGITIQANQTAAIEWRVRAFMDDPSLYERLDVFARVCDPEGYLRNGNDFEFFSGYDVTTLTTDHPGARVLSPDAVDEVGCTVVHFAAINDDVDSLFTWDTGGPVHQIQTMRGLKLGHDACASASAPERGITCDWEQPGLGDSERWYVGLNRMVGATFRNGTGTVQACFVANTDAAATPDVSACRSVGYVDDALQDDAAEVDAGPR